LRWRAWSTVAKTLSSAPVSDRPATDDATPELIDLLDPWTAGLLAWLVPGWGHWYQGRRPKAILFFLCIFGTFAFGCYLGETRVVYASWRPQDHRPAYLCQVAVGLPALPALVQAWRFRDPNLQIEAAERDAEHHARLGDWFMAPPFVLDTELFNRGPANAYEQDQRTLQQRLLRIFNPGQVAADDQADELDLLNKRLNRYFEFGTVYTMIAGLLNILAIYDAIGGPAQSDPVAAKRRRKQDADETAEHAA
jgi:hypothetical protein